MKRIFLTLALLACNFGYCLAGTTLTGTKEAGFLHFTDSVLEPSLELKLYYRNRINPEFQILKLPEVAINTKIGNNTGKDITGIKYTITYKNSFHDVILRENYTDNTLIKAGTNKLDFNTYFSINHLHPKREELAILINNNTLQIEIEITAVAFADGTVWRKEGE